MSFILLSADPLFHLLFLLIFTPFSISVSVSLARNRGDRESRIYIPFTIKHCLLSAAVYKSSIISNGYTLKDYMNLPNTVTMADEVRKTPVPVPVVYGQASTAQQATDADCRAVIYHYAKGHSYSSVVGEPEKGDGAEKPKKGQKSKKSQRSEKHEKDRLKRQKKDAADRLNTASHNQFITGLKAALKVYLKD
ncbi:hypothetical protein K449DRAFT_433686 [Hypoxylon sp. EC38]|nr:hypothetical protein K449DRAFT_433686 [Hypoxylon sp. EC38]